jgi:hypothetical protein
MEVFNMVILFSPIAISLYVLILATIFVHTVGKENSLLKQFGVFLQIASGLVFAFFVIILISNHFAQNNLENRINAAEEYLDKTLNTP